MTCKEQNIGYSRYDVLELTQNGRNIRLKSFNINGSFFLVVLPCDILVGFQRDCKQNGKMLNVILVSF